MSQQCCLPLPSQKERHKIIEKLHSKKKSIEEDIQNSDNKAISMSGKMEIDGDHFQEMSAMEYLAQVHSEAQALPHTRTYSKVNANMPKSKKNASPPIDGISASLHHLLSHRTTLPPCPTHTNDFPNPIMPLAKNEWVDAVLSDFSELRLYLSKCADAGVGKERLIQNLPAMKDRAGWHVFCLGTYESEGNVNDYFHDDGNHHFSNEQNIDDTDIKTLPERPDDNLTVREGHPPTIQLILQMDQVMTRMILSHHVYFLTEKWEATSSRMLWIYSLLANLKKPLHRDDVANLRKLLMECCSRRWQLSKHYTTNDIHVEPSSSRSEKGQVGGAKCCTQGLNLIICIIGIYFEQGKREEIMGPETI